MAQIQLSRKMRKVSKHGSSLSVTLPAEFNFNVGDDVMWAVVEGGMFTLTKIEIDGGVPHHTKIDRRQRKTALYEKIRRLGELVNEDYLLARFAIESGISLTTLEEYRDELLDAGLIERIDDTLQAV